VREHEHPDQYGFTLVEAVVSVSIVAVISVVLLVGASSARRGAAVRNGAQQVAGFLREAAALTVNGVKEPTCGIDAACSSYRVSYPVVGSSVTYTRVAEGGGASATRTLPAGTRFTTSGFVIFRLTPPVLSVAIAPVPVNSPPVHLPPGSKLSIPVEHRSGGSAWNVCVDGSGGVLVTAGAC